RFSAGDRAWVGSRWEVRCDFARWNRVRFAANARWQLLLRKCPERCSRQWSSETPRPIIPACASADWTPSQRAYEVHLCESLRTDRRRQATAVCGPHAGRIYLVERPHARRGRLEGRLGADPTSEECRSRLDSVL